MSFEAAVHAQAIELDRLSLEMCAEAGSGHPSSAMSLGHIVTTLMFHTMRWSPEYPAYPTSDRLILSEGHAVPIVYAAYARLGGTIPGGAGQSRPMTIEDLMTLRAVDSVLDGHPNPMEGFPFFDSATGSLGQGLSTAVGLALAAQLDGLDRRFYCIIGDGESREGQVAEALDMLAERGLNTVLPIFNCNGFGQTGRIGDPQSPEMIGRKLEALGFTVHAIDGHNPSQIKAALDAFVAGAGEDGSAPMAVVATTVKGWGAPVLQSGNWHGKPPVGETLNKALAELDERRIELTSSLVHTDAFTIQPPREAPERAGETGEAPSFNEMMRRSDMESVLHTGRLATRKAFGLALKALGQVNPNVVSIDGDVSNSTFAETFARDAELAPRFFEARIAEQNMVSMGVGFSAAGKIPFVSTFAKFMTRAYDQIEMAINSGANIKLVGSHAGISLAADGPSQMSLPDIAWFRSFSTVRDHRGNPACYVLQPSDAYAAYALTMAMAEYDGACYMRTLRPETEFLYSDNDVFNLGGFQVLSEGRDVLLVAAGYMVHEANKALDKLDGQGISATLVDLYSLPFDGDALCDLAQANNGYVISLEDNYGGSIGSAVADALTESGDAFSLKQMHVARIPKSARTPEQELAYCGLTADDITSACLHLLEVGAV
ncbi:MAG: transketolase [Phycisphaeraceae bacterium]|nr:transketolase [Phycisphaeraceae bacterium]MCB9847240.1 transketolase [Phycisphaeraceae bacterium]